MLIQIWARDSELNNWEHRGEGMYCPRALLKIPGTGTTFFFALRTPLFSRDQREKLDECLAQLPDVGILMGDFNDLCVGTSFPAN